MGRRILTPDEIKAYEELALAARRLQEAQSKADRQAAKLQEDKRKQPREKPKAAHD